MTIVCSVKLLGFSGEALKGFLLSAKVRVSLKKDKVWRANVRGYLNKYPAMLPAHTYMYMNGAQRKGAGGTWVL